MLRMHSIPKSMVMQKTSALVEDYLYSQQFQGCDPPSQLQDPEPELRTAPEIPGELSGKMGVVGGERGSGDCRRECLALSLEVWCKIL